MRYDGCYGANSMRMIVIWTIIFMLFVFDYFDGTTGMEFNANGPNQFIVVFGFVYVIDIDF